MRDRILVRTTAEPEQLGRVNLTEGSQFPFPATVDANPVERLRQHGPADPTRRQCPEYETGFAKILGLGSVQRSWIFSAFIDLFGVPRLGEFERRSIHRNFHLTKWFKQRS